LERLASAPRTIVAPFSAETKSMAAVVERDGRRVLLWKGAAGVILKRCKWLRTPGGDVDLAQEHASLEAAIAAQQGAGARCLAVAERDLQEGEVIDLQSPLSLVALLGFADPPRPGAAAAMAAAEALGVQVKVVTGDALGRAAALVKQIGLDVPPDAIVPAEELRGSDAHKAARRGRIFAEVVPADKFRLVRLLQSLGSHVAMTGNGVNDAPALGAADVGIAMASGSDAAKGAADIVLLENNLQVIVNGIAAGRRIFTNINRYLLYTMVSNFANVFIVAIASLFLDFLPLLPSQVLLLNLLADLPMLAIASDRVGDEDVALPRHWDVRRIVELAVYLGIINAFGAFGLLRVLHGQTESVVQTAWFLYLGSTALLVMFVVRTPRWIFRAPTPSWQLLVALGMAMLLTLAVALLPPTQTLFGLTPITPDQWLAIGVFAIGYLVIAELAKRTYVRASPIPIHVSTLTVRASGGLLDPTHQ
jgi:Mg2+-importing ATPase